MRPRLIPEIAADRIAFERVTFTFEFPGTAAAMVDEFATYYGPTMNAFDAARKNGKEAELRAELEALFKAQNKSNSPDTSVQVATFLKATVQV